MNNVGSDIVVGMDAIAQYCNISTIKARELVESGVIPTIVKKTTSYSRHITYKFILDYIAECIRNSSFFQQDANTSGKAPIGSLFTKQALFSEDFSIGKNHNAITFANCNLKGGVGKTTSSVSLASALSILWNSKVLIIETDPQSNISLYFGRAPKTTCFSDVVLNFISANKIVDLEQCISGYEFTNSKFDVLEADHRMLGKIEKINDLNFLKNVVYRLKNMYDFIIIDTPPSMQASLHMAYVASDFINLVTLPENLSVGGVKNLINGIVELNEENVANGNVDDICLIEHAIVTNFDTRLLNDQIENLLNLEKTLSEYDIETEQIYKLKKSVIYPESTSANCPIFDNSFRHQKSAEDGAEYFKLALEIFKKGKGNK